MRDLKINKTTRSFTRPYTKRNEVTMELTTDKVIATYLKLRGQKEAIEAEAKEKVADIKANLLKLEAWLKEKMDADGETSKKTAFGTAFITTTDFAQVEIGMQS